MYIGKSCVPLKTLISTGTDRVATYNIKCSWCPCFFIPYMRKLLAGRIFSVFLLFQSNRNKQCSTLEQNHACLRTGHWICCIHPSTQTEWNFSRKTLPWLGFRIFRNSQNSNHVSGYQTCRAACLHYGFSMTALLWQWSVLHHRCPQCGSLGAPPFKGLDYHETLSLVYVIVLEPSISWLSG